MNCEFLCDTDTWLAYKLSCCYDISINISIKWLAGAGDHTPSRICIHVGAEVEGVLGVNQISLLPYANEKVATKVLEHAQGLKETDPKQSIELHEEVIRLLCAQIKDRNKKIRVLKKILLDTLPEGEGA